MQSNMNDSLAANAMAPRALMTIMIVWYPGSFKSLRKSHRIPFSDVPQPHPATSVEALASPYLCRSTTRNKTTEQYKKKPPRFQCHSGWQHKMGSMYKRDALPFISLYGIVSCIVLRYGVQFNLQRNHLGFDIMSSIHREPRRRPALANSIQMPKMVHRLA